jgi:hypothetical protein
MVSKGQLHFTLEFVSALAAPRNDWDGNGKAGSKAGSSQRNRGIALRSVDQSTDPGNEGTVDLVELEPLNVAPAIGAKGREAARIGG